MSGSVGEREVSDTATMPTNDPITFDDDLRDRMADRLASHDRLELPLDGRRHAAVAIVIVDSMAGADADDPYEFSDEEMGVIPGYTGGLDGRMAGVAGGASFVLCRRSAGPPHRGRPAGCSSALPGRVERGRVASVISRPVP